MSGNPIARLVDPEQPELPFPPGDWSPWWRVTFVHYDTGEEETHRIQASDVFDALSEAHGCAFVTKWWPVLVEAETEQ